MRNSNYRVTSSVITEWPLIMQWGGVGLEEGRLKLCRAQGWQESMSWELQRAHYECVTREKGKGTGKQEGLKRSICSSEKLARKVNSLSWPKYCTGCCGHKGKAPLLQPVVQVQNDEHCHPSLMLALVHVISLHVTTKPTFWWPWLFSLPSSNGGKVFFTCFLSLFIWGNNDL